MHEYEQVPTLYPMAPDELLMFTSCNCNGNCFNRGSAARKIGSRESRYFESVKVLHAEIAVLMGLSLEKS